MSAGRGSAGTPPDRGEHNACGKTLQATSSGTGHQDGSLRLPSRRTLSCVLTRLARDHHETVGKSPHLNPDAQVEPVLLEPLVVALDAAFVPSRAPPGAVRRLRVHQQV